MLVWQTINYSALLTYSHASFRPKLNLLCCQFTICYFVWGLPSTLLPGFPILPRPFSRSAILTAQARESHENSTLFDLAKTKHVP